MNIKLYTAVAVMLSLVAVTPAQTKRVGAAAPPSNAAVQKNQLQNNRLPDSKNRVFEIRTYIIAQKWEAFFNDPKWKQDRAAFIVRYGKITDKIESRFVSPVDFSPLK